MPAAYSMMKTANVYKEPQLDESYGTVKRGFVKTIIHIVLLLILIIVLCVYYSRIEEAKKHTLTYDKETQKFIPFSVYKAKQNEVFVELDTAFICECATSSVPWGSVITSITISDDYVCPAAYISYAACYNDTQCRDGPVGNQIYQPIGALCGTAYTLYPEPSENPESSIVSSTLLTEDTFFELEEQFAFTMQEDIARSFRTSFEMTYPLVNADFYDWAWDSTFEELSNESYWIDQWNMSDFTAFGVASGWQEVDSDSLPRFAHAINEAFLNYIYIDYVYTSSNASELAAAGKEPLNLNTDGYYESCQPQKCEWVTIKRKGWVEIVTIVFGVLGGVHAALFIVINAIKAIADKVCSKTPAAEEEDNAGNNRATSTQMADSDKQEQTELVARAESD
eukprot:CAMPEP_0202703864 /NCGR_PEP_ID=MMETSP1385-20130828/16660_1 /ASSEMBLY_ACC=CAM_ASM_000861 /TAXON_ID=933848 /ORGANISM="Elphidium margaritaceum" /LENGTH=394 /DNA_ID=CAMNT_0049361783 /DNA_START=97 /DNA_END=1281 /DNA_ORIENTATION=+